MPTAQLHQAHPSSVPVCALPELQHPAIMLRPLLMVTPHHAGPNCNCDSGDERNLQGNIYGGFILLSKLSGKMHNQKLASAGTADTAVEKQIMLRSHKPE